MASTTRRMSAEFLPVMPRRGISTSSMAASCSPPVYMPNRLQSAYAFLATIFPFSTSRSRTLLISNRSRRLLNPRPMFSKSMNTASDRSPSPARCGFIRFRQDVVTAVHDCGYCARFGGGLTTDSPMSEDSTEHGVGTGRIRQGSRVDLSLRAPRYAGSPDGGPRPAATTSHIPTTSHTEVQRVHELLPARRQGGGGDRRRAGDRRGDLPPARRRPGRRSASST